jgi:hypothetical protein
MFRFGPLHEAAYSNYVFCSNCKLYEDALTSGLSKRIDQNSKRFQCTANHVDFCFPIPRLMVVESVEWARAVSYANDIIAKESCFNVDEEQLDASHTMNLCGTCRIEDDSSLHEVFDTWAQTILWYGRKDFAFVIELWQSFHQNIKGILMSIKVLQWIKRIN